MGGGAIMKKVGNGDIGRGGSKIWHFCVDIIFEWPLTKKVNYLKNEKSFLDEMKNIFYFYILKGLIK